MSDEGRYFRVGAFVLLGTALLVAAIIVLGGTSYLDRPVVFETYFDESVQGLEVGAPVKFRGVRIGTVSHIGFVEDAYEFADADERLRYGLDVIVRMDMVGNEPGDTSDRNATTDRAYLTRMVDRGLRLRLATQGLTGTSYIEADYYKPAAYPPPVLAWKPADLYVPSAPSRLRTFSSAAERLFSRVESVDVEGVLENLDRLLESVTRVADQVDIASLEKDAVELIAELRTTSIAVRQALTSASLQKLPKTAEELLAELTGTLHALRAMIDSGKYDVEVTVENLRVVSENLRDITSTAKDYPSYMILGRPPERSGPGGE